MNARLQRSWRDLCAARIVEILIAIVLALVATQIFVAVHDGHRITEREALVVEVLEAVHAAEKHAFEGAQHYEWLSVFAAAAAPASPLARLRVAADPAHPDVELFSIDGYFVAIALDDPDTNSGRVFAPTPGRGAILGQREYEAFAWPIQFNEQTDWVYFVSKRGLLLGSRNANGLFDGVNEPFPPVAHPLQEFMRANKDAADGEWELFKDVGEILAPGP